MTAQLAAWWAGLGERERWLVRTAALLVVGTGVVLAVTGTRERHDVLGRRIAAHQRELAQVRALAAMIAPAQAASTGSALARVQAAADATGVTDRVAALTPAGLAGTAASDRVTLRVTGASLAETVQLLHALDHDRPPLHIARLSLQKHAEDPARFDLVAEVADR